MLTSIFVFQYWIWCHFLPHFGQNSEPCGSCEPFWTSTLRSSSPRDEFFICFILTAAVCRTHLIQVLLVKVDVYHCLFHTYVWWIMSRSFFCAGLHLSSHSYRCLVKVSSLKLSAEYRYHLFCPLRKRYTWTKTRYIGRINLFKSASVQ